MPRERLHFVTGRLAEFALRRVLDELSASVGFDYSVDVLAISVAALMTPAWVASRICVPPGTTRVLLPGWCQGDLEAVECAAGVPVACGPKDLRDLPKFFGQQAPLADYGRFDIEILAEINHAPRLPLAELLVEADRLRADGADVIDLGCDPAHEWTTVADAVRALRDRGHRVSIDTMNASEAAAATAAGAELVLSVNASNRRAALDWPAELVVVPDAGGGLETIESTLELLNTRGARFRIDPILEPIGFGFAASLGRYLEVRRRWPDAELLMGIGNLTELTDVDSAGVNVLLLGFCQEVGIRSVLTTQVINWARSSVRECDLARRLVWQAVAHRQLPKHVEPRLVMLRDPEVQPFGAAALERLAQEIKDPNYRIFAEEGQLHIMAAGIHLHDVDPFALFARLAALAPRHLDPEHSFYLGFELAKAVTALTLGKQYRQDQSLDWGFLTRPEESHHARQRREPADESATTHPPTERT
ncbi:MAG: dihydropteroate synthase [Pirellulales bacterium]|nr:dihydropteroate synthase [Pirellulales bacterium]